VPDLGLLMCSPDSESGRLFECAFRCVRKFDAQPTSAPYNNTFQACCQSWTRTSAWSYRFRTFGCECHTNAYLSVPKLVNDGSIYPTNERQQKHWSRAGSSQGKSLSVNPSRYQ